MECLLALCLTLGLTANTYETLTPTYALHVKAGNELYVWASAEEQDVRLLGQPIAATSIYGAGVGARHQVGNFFGFIEVGYAVTNESVTAAIADEVIYAVLVNNHGVRTIPSGDPSYDPDSHVSYELDDGVVGRVGVGYQLGHLQITAAYRTYSVREHYKLWSDEVLAKTGGWWQESHGRDLSAFEVGVSWTF